jgi:general secretion pathway protein K
MLAKPSNLIQPSEKGAALITVTWVVLILSAMTVSILTLTKTNRQSIAAVEESVKAQFEMRSLMTLFMNRFFYNEDNVFFTRGNIEFNGSVYEITIQHEAGKINLNRSDLATLSLSFAAAGAEHEQAKYIAGAIIDWRDSDNEIEPIYGSEADDYLLSSNPIDYSSTDQQIITMIQPRNGPFESIGELMSVKGVTEKLYLCVEPILTVSSLHGNIDPTYASSEMRQVLSWARENNWENREWPDPTGTEIENPTNPSEFGGRAISVQIRKESQTTIFQQIVRFKSVDTLDYEPLTPVTKMIKSRNQPSCH